MPNKNTRIASRALENMFMRGSIYLRVCRMISILVLPFFLFFFEFFRSNAVYNFVAGDLGFPMFYGDFVAGILPWLIGIFVFWLWEVFLCINPKNVTAIKFEFAERVFLRASVLLFFWFVIYLEWDPYIHGPDLFLILFGIARLVVLVAGMVLVVRFARDRKSAFWIIVFATMMSFSYVIIPSMARFCSPSVVIIEDPRPPRLNPIEKVWKYCF